MTTPVDLESLVSLEQTFYDEGYTGGFAHGRIHGLIEGRALGREKGYEMWEEIGFYEGFARTWTALLSSTGQNDHRAVSHADTLLHLISHFPRVNPSNASSTSASATESPEAEVDILKILRQIRSRYKLLCSSLSIRPSLRASEGDEGSQASLQLANDGEQVLAKVKKTVWKLDGSAMPKPPAPQGLSF